MLWHGVGNVNVCCYVFWRAGGFLNKKLFKEVFIMKNTWKVLALLLCLTMLFGAVSCTTKKKDEDDTKTNDNTKTEYKVGGSVIIGSATALSGTDFRSTAWSNNGADADIRTLTNGYATVQQNKAGEFVWDETVTVKSHETIDNADGSKTFKITINEGLKYSDGSAITAKDYVGYALALATPVVLDAGISSPSGSTYVGYADFSTATSPTPFSGIRLYDDYTFSYTVEASYFPYYYELQYAAYSPYSLKLWLGDDVDVKDDGEGAYLTEAWYAKTTDSNGTEKYKKADQLLAARDNTDANSPCSGPYKFVKWDKSSESCQLTINENYQGNFEGQKPHVKDLTYIKIVAETQLDLFTSGGVDVISGLAEGDEINAALAAVEASDGKYAFTNYLRAGYGKIQLVADYGPTQFTKVRQALSHLLDKNKFASTFTGGYGSLVKGPYGLSSWMYQETKDELEATLNAYEFSLDTAKALLVEDGWVYGADGKTYTSGIRYKKLTAAEAAVNGNATYQCGNTDYKTVKIGDDYYMPLALNWCSSEGNSVSDLLNTMLVQAQTTADAGMVINQDVVDFNTLLDALYRDGVDAKYSMFNLATGFTSTIYDYAGYWMPKYSYSNIMYAGVTPCEGATYTEADADKYSEDEKAVIMATWEMYMGMGNQAWLSDEKMDEYTWDMVYKATTKEEYKEYFVKYIQRWNELLPEIALYSNLYHDVYNAKLGGYEVNPYWGVADAMLYCYDTTVQ